MSDDLDVDEFNSKLAELLSRPLVILPPSGQPESQDPGLRAFLVRVDEAIEASRQRTHDLFEDFVLLQLEQIRDQIDRAMMARTSSEQPGIPPRLQTIIKEDGAYFLVDGEPRPAAAVAVHYVARLIEANGEPAPFRSWIAKHPEFEGETSNRVRKKIPAKVMEFIDWPGGRGKSPSIKRDRLYPAPNV
jgi:hypothetical protein